jgi:peptidyl-prolyl cis-trans isomerase B (cyclophilin B)
MYKSAPPMTIDVKKSYEATIATAKGNIVVELYPKDAPQTVNNFVFLARDGFYNGLTFHRVEPGFVIQGGDPSGNGTGGPGYTIPAEIRAKHTKGAIAMARLGDNVNPRRDSSGSQFYITLAPTPFLDGQYTAFGQVTQGEDVVSRIARGDKIVSVTIVEK